MLDASRIAYTDSAIGFIGLVIHVYGCIARPPSWSANPTGLVAETPFPAPQLGWAEPPQPLLLPYQPEKMS